MNMNGKIVIRLMQMLGIMLLLVSCSQKVENPELVNKYPNIFPDYIDVTIPADIAPLNFNIVNDKNKADDADCVDVIAYGSKGGEIHSQGEYADFDIDEWHKLTQKNKGGDISFKVCVLKDGRWTQYKEFSTHVSNYSLDDYGLVYRRIAPGYEVGGNIGLYQRDIHSFDEYSILNESLVPGQCMNCHTPNKTSSDEFMFHIRGDKSATVIQREGKQTWINTRTDSTKANCSYSYWHPKGRFVVSSTNKVHQLFRTGNEQNIEVFDIMSDVLVIDTQNNELILSPYLQTDNFETYPSFSSDGKTIYFCSARFVNVPAEIEKIRYSLCKIGFDAEKGEYVGEVDTLINADSVNMSITFPRPSYDGKWIMYNTADYGNFPVNHKESDIWIMNLRDNTVRPLKEVNSMFVDSYHTWSGDSHWFAFTSKRIDGTYNNIYFACIGDNGKVTKPFLMPQRNPLKYYSEMFDSFNCPEFTKAKVDFDSHEAYHKCMDNQRIQMTIK